MTDWMDFAACGTQPSAWWTEKPRDGYWGSGRNATAIDICEGCPVARDCLLWTLRAEGAADGERRWGIAGATTPEQRARLASQAGVGRRRAAVDRKAVS